MARASCVIDAKSPVFAPAVRLPQSQRQPHRRGSSRQHFPGLRHRWASTMLGEWSSYRLDECRPEDFAGKYLHDVRAALHGLDHFAQRPSPRHVGYLIAIAEARGIRVERRADHILRAARMAMRAVSGSSTVPAPTKIWPENFFARCSITPVAPGTVKVISMAATPPRAQASAMPAAWSGLSARITQTRPEATIFPKTSNF